MSLDNIEDAYALSPIQTGMLFDSLATPDTDVYVAYVTIDIVGNIDSDRLMQAWTDVFKKYQSLRAAFHWDGLDEPLQVIAKDIELVWNTQSWIGETSDSQALLMQQLVQSERKEKFDLSLAPLSRFNLVRIEPNLSRLVWSVHHLLADGLSTPIILEDVQSFYFNEAASANSDHSNVYQYSQYSQWLSEQNHDEADEFWKIQLEASVPTPTRLPNRVIPKVTSQVQLSIPQIKFEMPADQSRAIESFCKSNRITLSTFLHGAWALLLREYSGMPFSLFASTVSGRHADIDGMSQAVGLYLNAQPRLMDTSVDKSLVDWLRAVQSDIHQCAKYDYSSLGKIQEYINTETNESPFESIITIGGHPSELDVTPDGQDVMFTNIQYQSTQSHYALAFLAFPGESLGMSLVYDPSRYLPEDIDRMSLYLVNLINQMLCSPNETPRSVTKQCVNLQRQARVAAEFTYDDAATRTIHGWFEAVVDRAPNDIALRFDGSSVSYSALDEQANQVAHYILSTMDSANVAPIGLMLPRGVEQIACMLGILKSGHAYVPIDPEFPTAIIQSYVTSAGIKYVVSSESCFDNVGLHSVECLPVGRMKNESALRPKNVQVDALSLAYVMFTSGSTGTPKGVQISHANLLYSTEARLAYYGDTKPHYLLLSSIAFDSSVAGIYWSLCTGGVLVLPRPAEEKNIQSIGELIQYEAVSHTLCLPSYYQLLLQNVASSLLDTLRVVIVAGEACVPELVKHHFDSGVNADLFNEYGPTEACVWSSVHKFSASHTGAIPIGAAIGSTYLQVNNEHGLPCPPGVEGEIVIGGSGLSPGYINDQEFSARKFVPNSAANGSCPVIYKTGDLAYLNADGNLVFTGRIDRQLKIRGHRIEPGAVEATLNKHEGIEQSVVVAIEHDALLPTSATGQSRERLLQRLVEDFSPADLLQAMDSLSLVRSENSTLQNGAHSE